MLDARQLIDHRVNLLWLTFDTLRFDVAEQALRGGRTPVLQEVLPHERWERRHTPATFTYAAHHAFFSGYLPTPIPRPADYTRLFACAFEGSSTTGAHTWTCPEATLPQGLAQIGYHTICIGGVGFFNLKNDLGRVLPGLFAEQHWSLATSVTDPDSPRHQVTLACERLAALPAQQPCFLFIDLAAMHQPNCMYLPGATEDSPASQLEALACVDRALPPLFAALQQRGETLCILTSDHGTAYGEDGCHGHGIAHPCVWEVPYAQFLLPGVVCA